jgi:acetylornithine/succinyldiaminopimelate/putrescine aminotransferase
MATQRQLFLRHIAQTSPAPMALEISKAKGVFLYDKKGKPYLDLIAGIGVSALGHLHPKVEAAVRKQMKKYWHTLVYGEFVLSPQVQLATLLAQQLGKLDSVFFTSSGTEATEGAMKLAKRYTGRTQFIACRNAYHGSTQGAASLMSPTYFIDAFLPLLPDIHHIEYNCDWCLQKITTQTAAVIVETVQGEAGLKLPRKEWLQALRNRCTETGTLLILDEIQAGYGRTGTLFAFEQYDIVPDILLLAKGFGGGMPIGAFIAERKVMQSLTHDPVLGHITTFGGHPLSAAAGLATLKILLDSDLIEQTKAKGQLFRDLMVHPQIIELRGIGLWFAIDLDSWDKVQSVIAHCLENGVITDWFLFNDRSLRVAPPLTITEVEIRLACRVILEGLDKINY